MKNDHSFTFTAAVILAGVILALVNPADATNTFSAAAKPTVTSNNLQNMVSAIAAVEAPATSQLELKGSHKGSCHHVAQVDPRA